MLNSLDKRFVEVLRELPDDRLLAHARPGKAADALRALNDEDFLSLFVDTLEVWEGEPLMPFERDGEVPKPTMKERWTTRPKLGLCVWCDKKPVKGSPFCRLHLKRKRRAIAMMVQTRKNGVRE